MAYLALYRAWRPQRFDEVVGQEQTVTALKNAIAEGRLSHAYLFSGPRGTGKTSIAKIVARAVNCMNTADGEPCNTCSSCIDINKGNFMDVIEIDAASNRGIDEIRELREKVRILPAQGKRKVYIIDEVHMLTTEAFNALLKTIEEPPESVIFILATTEAQKIPATILSRCQTYKFRRLTIREITSRLQDISVANEIEIDPEALAVIARRANGGLRDALSILDQVYSYQGNKINKEDVFDILGLVEDTFIAELIDAVIARETATIISMLSTAINQGKEGQQIARETVLYLRDLLLFDILGDGELLNTSEAGQEILKAQKKKVKAEKLLIALREMMDTADRLRFSEANRYQLELAFLEMGQILASDSHVQQSPVKKEPAVSIHESNAGTRKEDAKGILWKKILSAVKEKRVPTHALLAQGKFLGNKEGTLYIGYKKGYKFHKERMEEKANKEILESAVQEVMGHEMQIQFIFLEDEQYNDIVVKKAIEIFGEDLIEIKE